jgi:competence protein ComEC
MLRFAVLFAGGVVGFQQFAVIPGSGWLIATALLALPVWRLGALRPWVGLLLGFAWAHLHASLAQPADIPAATAGPVACQVTGAVASLPERLAERTRFVLLASHLLCPDGAIDGSWRLRVTWQHAPDLRPGQVWRLPLRVRPVHGFASPGAWDYERHLYHQGIRFTGYVTDRDQSPLALGEDRCCSVLRVRDVISRWLDGLDASAFARGVLRAIVVADRAGLSPSSRELFRNTGTSHLMAVSGLHIGLFAGLGFLLVRSVWRRLPTLCNRIPAPVAGTLGGLVCAVWYAMLAGMHLPTQRALIMLGVFAGAFLLRRRAAPWHALALAALAVLVWHPPSVLEAGFWLSFGAVAIITATLRHCRRQARWRQAVHVQLGVSVGLWPILLGFGMPVSAIAPAVNLLLVPVFGLLVVPLALLGTTAGLLYPPGGAWLLGLLGTGLDWMQAGLTFAAEVGSGLVGVPGMQPATLLLLAVMAVLWSLPPGLPLRVLAGPLLLAFLLPREPQLSPGEFHLQVLDVGQGLSAVIETRGQVLVFDTGPAFDSGFAASSAVVLPYLQRRGRVHIDRLVLSHGDRDHAGGVAQLLDRIRVAEIVSGEPERVGFSAAACVAGDAWRWDGVSFEFLYPPPGAHLQGNDASCVLRVANAAGSVLLTGDIARQGERALLETGPERLVSTVVVAPHHGSRSSSGPDFVMATQPDHVVYAAGWANRYGFPAEDVAARWRSAGAAASNTADAGTVGFQFRISGEVIGPTHYRRENARYWRHDSGSATALHAVSSVD